MRHILESQQFSVKNILEIFERVTVLEQETLGHESNWKHVQSNPTRPPGRRRYRQLRKQIPKGLTLVNFFAERSSRTVSSFTAAAQLLEMNTFNFPVENSSLGKGEDMDDTVRTLGKLYSGALVIRHADIGVCKEAARIIDGMNLPLSVINAGEGPSQHPTQALLDVYTIYRRIRSLKNLTVIVGGDLRYGRAAKSFIYLMAKFMPRFHFLSDPELGVPSDILEHLDENGVSHSSHNSSLDEFAENADVMYWTRMQDERWSEDLRRKLPELSRQYTVDTRIANIMKRNAIIMHPMPRRTEITRDVDSNPRAAYWDQIGYGKLVRASLILDVLVENPNILDGE